MVLNILHKYYFRATTLPSLFNNSFIRKAIWFVSNIYARYFLKSLSVNSLERKEKIIISVTSFPQRIKYFPIVFKSLTNQTLKADRIILWLSEDQFPNEESIPSTVRELQKYGLEIRICENDLGPHKKYFYAFQELPNDLIITVDDDFICHPNVVKLLVETYSIYNQKTLVALRSLNIPENTKADYLTWGINYQSTFYVDNIFFTSGGGTLFKPSDFESILFDKDVFMKICPKADDIWLNLNAKFSNIKIVTPTIKELSIPIFIVGNIELSESNLFQNGNNIQLTNTLSFFESTFNRVLL
jgi:hypothetical protein